MKKKKLPVLAMHSVVSRAARRATLTKGASSHMRKTAHTDRTTQARILLEDGLRSCIMEKFKTENSNRSGNVMNILHEAIYHAYAVLLKGSPLSEQVELCGEHNGKVVMSYGEGNKNVDLALKIRGSETFLDAIFVKAPKSNYAQNRKNYEEAMAGTFLNCRAVHRYLRVIFFDFLSRQDLYFDKQGNFKRWSALVPPMLSKMDCVHPAIYANAHYSYHPELLDTKEINTKEDFYQKCIAIEKRGEAAIQNIDVGPILEALKAMVADLQDTMDDAKQISTKSEGSRLDNSLNNFETVLEKTPNAGMLLGMHAGVIYAELGSYGKRQQKYLQDWFFRRVGPQYDTVSGWTVLNAMLLQYSN